MFVLAVVSARKKVPARSAYDATDDATSVPDIAFKSDRQKGTTEGAIKRPKLACVSGR